MSTTEISTFRAIFGQSLRNSNRQLFVLFKNILALFALLLAEMLPGMAVLYYSLFRPDIALFLQSLAVLYLFYVLVRYNGALGYVLAVIPTDTKLHAVEARAQGFKFLLNSIKTGVFIFLGQMFMVCACFLALSNFIFSPYLYIFEGLKGDEAEERSVVLASGYGWQILNWTVALLMFNYVFFIVAFMALFVSSQPIVAALVVLLLLYLGLFQSNFVRIIYLELLHKNKSPKRPEASAHYKTMVFGLLLFVILIFFILKVFTFYIQ
ncbi:MAG TPA: hypothetical protein VEA37_05720 [Flavobacterium sp.]|nr:hypothetical protein [Flavobacterium sp.]